MMNRISPNKSNASKSHAASQKLLRAKQNSKKNTITKRSLLLKALGRPRGTSMDVLCRDLNWQAPSVRAALSKLRKSGLEIINSKSKPGASVYRLVSNDPDGSNTSIVGERSS